MSSTTAPVVTDIDAHTLNVMMTAGEAVKVIDVRSPAEFETMHIRGSYNVPLPMLSEHAGELAERLDGGVVLVCQSGVRADQARTRLDGVGVEHAQVLDGGVPAFAAAGGDVVRGVQRWDLERQVRLVAGSLVVVGLLAGKFLSPKLRLLSGAIGTGLTVSAATNTCAMGQALSKMPWNQGATCPAPRAVIGQIPRSNS